MRVYSWPRLGLGKLPLFLRCVRWEGGNCRLGINKKKLPFEASVHLCGSEWPGRQRGYAFSPYKKMVGHMDLFDRTETLISNVHPPIPGSGERRIRNMVQTLVLKSPRWRRDVPLKYTPSYSRDFSNEAAASLCRFINKSVPLVTRKADRLLFTTDSVRWLK